MGLCGVGADIVFLALVAWLLVVGVGVVAVAVRASVEVVVAVGVCFRS